MPWSNQSGGGGRQSGGGGGPWGQGPVAAAGSQQPDLEEMLKRSQDKLKQVMHGGPACRARFCSSSPSVVCAVVAFYAFTFRVNPDELGVVMRFGKFDRARSRRACISACPIRSRRCACRR